MHSIRRQAVDIHEICIGVQHVNKRLTKVSEYYSNWPIIVAKTDKLGQAAAINAAAAHATGDIITFIEDDDEWHSKRLTYGLMMVKDFNFDFVSTNQQEVDTEGVKIRINDFPTPTGWLMTADLWRRSGGFDENFRWHLDNEYLGKIMKIGAKRIHLVERGAAINERGWLENVSHYSNIACTSEESPLGIRLRNPNGGMSRISADPVAYSQSRWEHTLMIERYGYIPW